MCVCVCVVGLTAENALAVDSDGDGEALHVGHRDAQYLAVVVEVPDTNVLHAARRHQLRTVTIHKQPVNQPSTGTASLPAQATIM